MGDDEVFLLVVSMLGSLWGIGLWGRFLTSGDPFRPRRHLRAIPTLICAVAMGLLFWVLRRWADDEVRDHVGYLTLLMGLGFALQAIAAFQIAPWFGLMAAEDIGTKGNSAAATAWSGLLLGLTFCFAGANTGEGPSLWNNVFSGALSIGGLFVLWAFIEAIGRTSASITEERDLASGLRLAAFFLAAGVILGRAVAGDWVSEFETVRDFARFGWPAAVLAVLAGISDKTCRPKPQNRFPNWGIYGLLPALFYGGAALVLMALVGGWAAK